MITSKVRMLYIHEMYFSASHWIPNHEKCGALHGHTFFVKELLAEVEGFVDFADIKRVVMGFDHMALIPQCDEEAWVRLHHAIHKSEVYKPLWKVFSRYRVIEDTDLPGTTIERIAEELKKEIEEIPGVRKVVFELCEGPNAGASV